VNRLQLRRRAQILFDKKAPFTDRRVQALLLAAAPILERQEKRHPASCCEVTFLDDAILTWLEPYALGPCLRYLQSLNL
jgi:hypothetical protein